MCAHTKPTTSRPSCTRLCRSLFSLQCTASLCCCLSNIRLRGIEQQQQQQSVFPLLCWRQHHEREGLAHRLFSSSSRRSLSKGAVRTRSSSRACFRILLTTALRTVTCAEHSSYWTLSERGVFLRSGGLLKIFQCALFLPAPTARLLIFYTVKRVTSVWCSVKAK